MTITIFPDWWRRIIYECKSKQILDADWNMNLVMNFTYILKWEFDNI